MITEPFHQTCISSLNKAAEKLNNTSMWVCRLDADLTSVMVMGMQVSTHASAMEKVSDLYETYPLRNTPTLHQWVLSSPKDKLVFQIKKMQFNDPDRREYFVNGVETVAFVPIYVYNKIWGILEVWDSSQPREYSEEDFAVLDTAVEALARLISKT